MKTYLFLFITTIILAACSKTDNTLPPPIIVNPPPPTDTEVVIMDTSPKTVFYSVHSYIIVTEKAMNNAILQQSGGDNGYFTKQGVVLEADKDSGTIHLTFHSPKKPVVEHYSSADYHVTYSELIKYDLNVVPTAADTVNKTYWVYEGFDTAKYHFSKIVAVLNDGGFEPGKIVVRVYDEDYDSFRPTQEFIEDIHARFKWKILGVTNIPLK